VSTLCDQVSQWLAADQWFLRVLRFLPPIKLTCHDITEILLKVALNTTKQTNKQTNKPKPLQLQIKLLFLELSNFCSSLDGIWTHTIDTLQHHLLSLTSSALNHSTTSTQFWCKIIMGKQSKFSHICYKLLYNNIFYKRWFFIYVYKIATGRWFSPGPPVSSTNKTDLPRYIRLKIKPNRVRIRF
jgi:hypothetical protein